MIAMTVMLISCDKNDGYTPPGNQNPPPPQSVVIKGAGDSATVVNFINQFRLLLGDPLNTTPNQTVGRREVNWDGVSPNLTNNNDFPLDFFNNTDAAGPNGRKRGLVYLGNNAIRVDSTLFSQIEPSYATQFQTFSGKRILVTAVSTVSEVGFKVPGTNNDAFVKGFGLVFTDVDDANSTSVEYFNGNKSLGVFKAPVRAAGSSYSFLGVGFPDEKITHVKITCGNAVLAAGVKDVSTAGGTKDVVAMDDFFYDEPKILQ